MSVNDRPELRAYRELELLVRSLGEELATFRKRALSAETRLKESDSGRRAEAEDGDGGRGSRASSAGAGRAFSAERVAELESENQSLRTRLGRAEDRVRQMLDRVRFLRQQIQNQPAAGAGRS